MIQTELHGPVTVLRLAHRKANALDLELLEAIAEAFAAAEREGQAVVLTGTGTIFSAGVDLFRVLNEGGPYVDAFLPALTRALERIAAHPRPVVAAVNGHAIAGGWILAAAADLRVMADGYGKLGVPELQVGVPFPPMALEVLRAATPPHLLAEMVFGGRTFTGAEAREHGLVEETAAPDEVLDRAVARAEALAALGAEAYALTKAALRAPTLDRARAAAAIDAEVIARWKAPATQDAIRAYLERTLGRR